MAEPATNIPENLRDTHVPPPLPATDAPVAPPAEIRGPWGIRLSPLNQRRWRNFKANRRAYWSLIVFSILFGLSL